MANILESASAEKIIKIRSELAIDQILDSDTIEEAIDKINSNFNQLSEFQGGRQGVPGSEGVPGCNTFLYGNESGSLVDNLPVELANREALYTVCGGEKIYPETTEAIYNKNANAISVFSNLTESDSELKVSEYTENTFTTLATSNTDHKIEVFNSDLDGVGNHILLANSKMIADNNSMLCHTGFSMGVDYVNPESANICETLRIEGLKPNVDGLTISNEIDSKIDLITDSISLKPSLEQQSLKIVAPENVGNQSVEFSVENLKQNESIVIPSRTGYMGVWQQFGETNSEGFNTFTNIIPIKYFMNNEGFLCDETFPYSVTNNSWIQFKQLNNFVLIQFKIFLENLTPNNESYNIQGIQFTTTEPTINCSTPMFTPCCNIPDFDENEYYIESNMAHFKIGAGVDKFIIKIASNISDSTCFTGQVWSEVSNDFCEVVELI